MSTLRKTAFVLAIVLSAATADAQIRGDGRIAGKVVDEEGKPMPEVVVRAVKAGESQPLQAKSNNRGDWAFNGIAEGEWNLEFAKEGYDPLRVTVHVDEGTRGPSVDVKMARPAPPPVDPNAELQEEINRAVPLLQEGKFAEARKIYEDLLAKYPTVHQLHRFIASAYAGEQNYLKAVEHLELALQHEPDDVELKLLTGDLLIETGRKEEGVKLLESIDITQVKDPASLINAAIQLINDKRVDDALAILDRINKQFPTRADVYYYRGRAYIVADKLPEAKAELEKFVSTAEPTARELPDAKKILEQLKDVK